MKTKKTIVLSLAGIMALGLMSFDILYSTGEADHTGSPADAGLTCATVGCHADNVVNTGGGSVTISASPSFVGGAYSPGSIYTISVTVAKTGQTSFGFDFEALKSDNTAGGTLATLNLGTQLMTGSGPVNMVHNGSGVGTDTHTFTFKWTAPVATAGTITFYASGNACNEDGATTGDFVYTTSLAATEGSSSVGIADYNNNSVISVYPNPATNNISIMNTSTGSLNAIMYDLTGKEVMNSGVISAQDNKLSVMNIANGTYILKLYNETGLLKSDRIVVMH